MEARNRMFMRLALRDASIVVGVAVLWAVARGASVGSGPLADLVGLILGLGVGAATFVLHEWGHCLGGLAVGARLSAPASLQSMYLFSFDTQRNSRSQFLVMSVGGFIVTGLALVFAYQALPDGLQATRVARGAILFLASLTVFLEFPLVLLSFIRPNALPPVEVFDASPEVAP